MTKNMTLNLFNIVSNYIGATVSRTTTPQHPIGFGPMDVCPNSKAQYLGFLWIYTQTWLMVVRWHGMFWLVGMERVHMMVLMLSIESFSRSFTHGNLYGSFLGLGSKWGINMGKTSHYLQYVNTNFGYVFFFITFVSINYQIKLCLNHLLTYIVFLLYIFVFPILDYI